MKRYDAATQKAIAKLEQDASNEVMDRLKVLEKRADIVEKEVVIAKKEALLLAQKELTKQAEVRETQAKEQAVVQSIRFYKWRFHRRHHKMRLT